MYMYVLCPLHAARDDDGASKRHNVGRGVAGCDGAHLSVSGPLAAFESRVGSISPGGREAQTIALRIALHEPHEAIPLVLALQHDDTLDNAWFSVDERRCDLGRLHCALRILQVHACGLAQLLSCGLQKARVIE